MKDSLPEIASHELPMITNKDLSPTTERAASEENRTSGPPGPTTVNLLRFGAFSLIAAAIVSLFPPLGTALYGPPVYAWALAALTLVVLAAAALLAMRWKELPSRPERWVIPMVATTGIALLASPFADRAAFPTLGLLLLPAAILVIAALVDSGKEDKARRCLHLFRAAATVAIIVCVWGLFSWGVSDFGAQVGFVDHLARISGLEIPYPGLLSIENPHPFGHKNFVAGFAILALPILLAVTCLDQSRLKLVWLAGLPLAGLYLVSAESRAGWLALAGGAAFYILLRVLRQRTAQLRWWLLPILLVILTIPFLASPRLRDSVERIGQEGTLAALDPYRWNMAQTGIAAGNARPLTGVGSGTLPLVSPEHSVSPEYPVVYQVHSTPIQIYAETGALGLLGCLALIFGLMSAWRRTGDDDALSDSGSLRDAAAVALVSYSIFALTDYQLDVPAIVLMAAVPAGALFGLARKNANAPVSHPWWLGAGIAAGLLLVPVFWFNGKGLSARLHLNEATAYLKSGDIDAFVSGATRAHERAPSDPFYLNQIANVWLTEWMNAENPAERNRFAIKAQTALENSLQIAPAQDSVHFNLGIALWSQKKVEESLEAMERALEYNPRKRFANFLRGKALLDLGKAEAAAEAFAKELLVNPASLFLPLWQEPEVQAHIERRNEYFKRLSEGEASSSVQRTRYLLFWSTAAPRPFEGNLQSQPPGFRVLLTALEGDPEAAVQIAPHTPEAFLVRAWTEPENAEHWLRSAFFQANGTAFSSSNLQLIAEHLHEGDTFAEGFRALAEEPGLPAEAKRGVPRASGLFERNFYGAPLFDFYVYHQPIVFLLF